MGHFVWWILSFFNPSLTQGEHCSSLQLFPTFSGNISEGVQIFSSLTIRDRLAPVSLNILTYLPTPPVLSE